jgi:hypothetical protein
MLNKDCPDCSSDVQSNKKQDELRSCPFCVCERLTVHKSIFFFLLQVICTTCCAQTGLYASEAEARLAWNRRATEPAAQWTSETPTENGTYVFMPNGCSPFGLFHKVGSTIVCGVTNYEISLFVERFKPQWYKIPEPPLPAELAEKEGGTHDQN